MGNPPPPRHDRRRLGLIEPTQGCVQAGGELVLVRDLDPAIVLRWIERHRVTNALSVPAVLRVLTATPGVDAIDFRSLRAIRLRGVAHLLRAAGKACGETVNAIVVGEPGRAASDAELIAWCRARRAHSI